jgi:hypothetical protein
VTEGLPQARFRPHVGLFRAVELDPQSPRRVELPRAPAPILNGTAYSSPRICRVGGLNFHFDN